MPPQRAASTVGGTPVVASRRGAVAGRNRGRVSTVASSSSVAGGVAPTSAAGTAVGAATPAISAMSAPGGGFATPQGPAWRRELLRQQLRTTGTRSVVMSVADSAHGQRAAGGGGAAANAANAGGGGTGTGSTSLVDLGDGGATAPTMIEELLARLEHHGVRRRTIRDAHEYIDALGGGGAATDAAASSTAFDSVSRASTARHLRKRARRGGGGAPTATTMTASSSVTGETGHGDGRSVRDVPHQYWCVPCEAALTPMLTGAPTMHALRAAHHHVTSAAHRRLARHMQMADINASLQTAPTIDRSRHILIQVNGFPTLVHTGPGGSALFQLLPQEAGLPRAVVNENCAEPLLPAAAAGEAFLYNPREAFFTGAEIQFCAAPPPPPPPGVAAPAPRSIEATRMALEALRGLRRRRLLADRASGRVVRVREVLPVAAAKARALAAKRQREQEGADSGGGAAAPGTALYLATVPDDDVDDVLAPPLPLSLRENHAGYVVAKEPLRNFRAGQSAVPAAGTRGECAKPFVPRIVVCRDSAYRIALEQPPPEEKLRQRELLRRASALYSVRVRQLAPGEADDGGTADGDAAAAASAAPLVLPPRRRGRPTAVVKAAEAALAEASAKQRQATVAAQGQRRGAASAAAAAPQPSQLLTQENLAKLGGPAESWRSPVASMVATQSTGAPSRSSSVSS